MWDEQRSARVLNTITDTPQTRSKSPYRWALVAATTALVVGIGLLAQSIIPIGGLGAPVRASALERLAEVTKTKSIPVGSYAQETMKSVSANGGVTTKVSTTRWVASDGWVWTSDVSTAAPHRVLSKSPDLAKGAGGPTLFPERLPSDPAVLKQQMLDRYTTSMATSSLSPAAVRALQAPSMLAAIYNKLSDPRVSHADRVVLLRTLPLIDGLTVVENTTDPEGRRALAARVAYHWDMDNVDLVASVYFDPTNGDPLAFEERTTRGTLWRMQVTTDQRIVTALPEQIVTVLGTKRVAKTVGSAADPTSATKLQRRLR